MYQASEIRSVAAQNAVPFIVIAVRTVNPSLYFLIDVMAMLLGVSGQIYKVWLEERL
jgi:hypothetical protein